jgi:L-threonylcarbamoyladenylate synthase
VTLRNEVPPWPFSGRATTDTSVPDTLITDDPFTAAEICRSGHAVAFPTETVYGLGGTIDSQEAIREIYSIKGRPANNPLIAHLADSSQIDSLAAFIPAYAAPLIEAFVPGPLTLVLRRAAHVPAFAFPGLDTIAVRVPDHQLARRFIEAVGVPVVAPSANRSGRPSPTRWEDVRDDLQGLCACILRGDPATRGLESTVLDCTDDVPQILRPGSVTLEDVRQIVPGVRSAIDVDLLARSPGTRFRHYAPDAAVILVDAPPPGPPDRAVFIGMSAVDDPGAWLATFQPAGLSEYGTMLYRALREADRLGASSIICQRVEPVGIGVAIMDRLSRAAAR